MAKVKFAEEHNNTDKAPDGGYIIGPKKVIHEHKYGTVDKMSKRISFRPHTKKSGRKKVSDKKSTHLNQTCPQNNAQAKSSLGRHR